MLERMLITSSHSSSIAGFATSTSTPSRLSTGMGRWLYTLPTAPFAKVALSNEDLSTGLGLLPQERDAFVENSYRARDNSARHRLTT